MIKLRKKENRYCNNSNTQNPIEPPISQNLNVGLFCTIRKQPSIRPMIEKAPIHSAHVTTQPRVQEAVASTRRQTRRTFGGGGGSGVNRFWNVEYPVNPMFSAKRTAQSPFRPRLALLESQTRNRHYIYIYIYLVSREEERKWRWSGCPLPNASSSPGIIIANFGPA